MKNVKISVIVPVYNAEKYFDKCINSIVSQTYDNLEIVLVDDGSKDSSAEMCDKWASKDDRIKVIHKHNGGVSSARNCGIDIASGEYIAFVDSDDYIDTNMYETMLLAAEKYSAEFIECSITRENPNGSIKHWGKKKKLVTIRTQKESLINTSSSYDFVGVHVCNKLISRDLIGTTRFDTSYKINEDVLFIYMLLLKTDKVVYIDIPMYHFINNLTSSTHTRSNDSLFDELKVADEIYKLSPQELYVFCAKGDALKTFSKLQELIINNQLTKENYLYLKKRIMKNSKLILSSNVFSKYTKIKTVLLKYSPIAFIAFYKLFGGYLIKRIQKQYLE